LGQTQRLIFLVLVIGWTIFRVVRYARMANSRRPAAAIPSVTGAPPPGSAPGPGAPTASAAAQSPIEPDGRGAPAAWLAAVAILVGGNVLIWGILFGVPAFDNVPVIWRLTAGVLANFFLIRVAGRARARAGGRAPRGPGGDRNPIG
jgi:hypothetical protein